MPDPRPVKFGLQLWSQQTDWPSFRDTALFAERIGWDRVWMLGSPARHLRALGAARSSRAGPCWPALGPITTRVRLGLMVGANTFRNPGVTAKLATTLDHVSGGRAVLGIGGAWFEREHQAFGIDFGASPGERLGWLDESVMLMRRLLDGDRVTHDGPRYTMHDALCEPRPVQPRLPILIGGSGRQKTLRTVAEQADGWNTSGTIDQVTDALRTLEQHCADVGRDPASIEKTVSFPLVLRDDPAAAEDRMRDLLSANGVAIADFDGYLAGSPEQIADHIRPYLALGFETIIVRMPAPFDHETIERMPEVASRLSA